MQAHKMEGEDPKPYCSKYKLLDPGQSQVEDKKNHMQILVLGSQGNDAKKSGDALQSPTEMDKVTMYAIVLFMLRLRGPNP